MYPDSVWTLEAQLLATVTEVLVNVHRGKDTKPFSIRRPGNEPARGQEAVRQLMEGM